MNPIRICSRWPLHAAILATCGASLLSEAANVEPTPVPSVYPTLAPTSAIQVPLRLAADQTSVWSAKPEQRMLLTGHVNILVGYRTLQAEAAAVWLTPSRESGVNTYEVAIYLSGNVLVREGNSPSSTTTVGPELLVTTRIMQSVQLSGMPVAKQEEESVIVKRGDEIRQQILHRPPAIAFIPTIVISPAEDALQAGWIARGPNNRIIAGPGEIKLVRNDQGVLVPTTLPGAPKPAKPRPNVFATGDDIRTPPQIGKEQVTIVSGAYLLYDAQDTRPPLEFRAQRMVVFSPVPEAAATAPGTAPAPGKDLTQLATGVYLEGDVTLDQGNQVRIRAERVYYDFTSQRAIMLDATLSTIEEKREVPIYLRAAEIRQLARGEWAAKKVSFSTSEFYTPHYHIGASEIYLRDITPQLETPNAGATPGSAALGLAGGMSFEESTYQYQLKDATLNVSGVPIFYWPSLAGDTAKNEIPLRTIRVSNSRTYGLSLMTDWDIFALAGQTAPEGVRADLNLDYFGKRGPGGGVQSEWTTADDHGVLRTYALLDQGTDRLGRDRNDIKPPQEARGRATLQDQRDLGNGLTLQVEASYLSDPNFLEQFFQREFDAEKQEETSLYLKKQDDTSALTFLGKFNLMDFTSSADRIDDQFLTEKKPEIKYWRIGDSFLDLFTYYSETGGADLHTDITNFTPTQIGMQQSFLGPPANVVPLDKTYREYLHSQGWVTSNVLRADTRHELDMPLRVGDAKITPYITGRATFWDADFPETPGGGSTSRLWGGAGVRSSMQFWHVYDDVQSTFFDVHRLRHIIEPQFNLFVTGTNVERSDLQPFDRDVEGISGGSGMQLALNQKWQTKRGGEGHWRDVDWITLNVSWNQFWNKDNTSLFFPLQPLRGYYFASRPDLSLVRNSINVDGTWRLGERARLIGESDYSLDKHRFEQLAAGLAIDQTKSLSYFIGNRYIGALDTDEWTFAVDYQLTQKYQVIAAESYDFQSRGNILTSVTLVRKLPRFFTALTVNYDANNADTTFMFTAWPEGFPNSGFGNHTGGSGGRR